MQFLMPTNVCTIKLKSFDKQSKYADINDNKAGIWNRYEKWPYIGILSHYVINLKTSLSLRSLCQRS